MKLFAIVITMLLTTSCMTASAAERCGHIRSRPDRLACYDRQSAARLAKQKTTPPARSGMDDSIEQMKIEDDKLTKKLQGICRKC